MYNLRELEDNHWLGYEACKAKDMGDASTRKDEEAEPVHLVALKTSPATSNQQQNGCRGWI